DARDVGNARPGPGGDDNFIKMAVGERGRVWARLQTQGNAEFGDARAKVAQRLIELFLAWDVARQIELSADAGLGFKQRDLMATLGGGQRARQSSRSGTDDGDAANMGRRRPV